MIRKVTLIAENWELAKIIYEIDNQEYFLFLKGDEISFDKIEEKLISLNEQS